MDVTGVSSYKDLYRPFTDPPERPSRDSIAAKYVRSDYTLIVEARWKNGKLILFSVLCGNEIPTFYWESGNAYFRFQSPTKTGVPFHCKYLDSMAERETTDVYYPIIHYPECTGKVYMVRKESNAQRRVLQLLDLH